MRGYLSNFFFSSRLAVWPGRALAAEMSPALEENGVTIAVSKKYVWPRKLNTTSMRAPSGCAPGWGSRGRPGMVCSM